MRVGYNPLRTATFKPAPPVVAAVCVHFRGEHAYHRERLPIVRACLETVRAAGVPMLIWDNGSDDKFRAWLDQHYRDGATIVYSPNIGKPNARAATYGMYPPETLIYFTDDDILHYPGWLDAHLELYRAFPNVGAVSGWPIAISFGWGIESTLKWARKYAEVEEGRFTTDEDETDYAVSVGACASSWIINAANRKQYRITYKGIQALAEAQHCQMLGQAGRLVSISRTNLPPNRADMDLDRAIDAAGMLRLTTTKRVVRHMGNMLDDKLKAELEEMKLL